MSSELRAVLLAAADTLASLEDEGATIHVDIGLDFRRGQVRPQFTLARRVKVVALDSTGSGGVVSCVDSVQRSPADGPGAG